MVEDINVDDCQFYRYSKMKNRSLLITIRLASPHSWSYHKCTGRRPAEISQRYEIRRGPDS